MALEEAISTKGIQPKKKYFVGKIKFNQPIKTYEYLAPNWREMEGTYKLDDIAYGLMQELSEDEVRKARTSGFLIKNVRPICRRLDDFIRQLGNLYPEDKQKIYPHLLENLSNQTGILFTLTNPFQKDDRFEEVHGNCRASVAFLCLDELESKKVKKAIKQ